MLGARLERFASGLRERMKVVADPLQWCVHPVRSRTIEIRTALDDQEAVRVPPVVLAAARRAPPVAPKEDFLREALAMRAEVRQGDPTLPFPWCNNTSKEVCTLSMDFQHDGNSVLVFFFDVTTNFLQGFNNPVGVQLPFNCQPPPP